MSGGREHPCDDSPRMLIVEPEPIWLVIAVAVPVASLLWAAVFWGLSKWL